MSRRKQQGQGRGKRPAQERAGRRQKTVPRSRRDRELMRVRRSRVHGRGVFAVRRIRKGTRIIEYLGDRVSHRRRICATSTRTSATTTRSCSSSIAAW
jgi:hypothetical protein